MNAYPICLGVILNDLGGAPLGKFPQSVPEFFRSDNENIRRRPYQAAPQKSRYDNTRDTGVIPRENSRNKKCRYTYCDNYRISYKKRNMRSVKIL